MHSNRPHLYAKIGGISSGDNMNGTKLVVNASSLLLATARARCVFVHVAVSVRLPSPRALRRNDYIYRAVCTQHGAVTAVRSDKMGGFSSGIRVDLILCISTIFDFGRSSPLPTLRFFCARLGFFCNELRINFTTCRLLVFGLILLLPLIFGAYSSNSI